MSMYPEGTLAAHLTNRGPRRCMAPGGQAANWRDLVEADKARINVSHALALIELEDTSKERATSVGRAVAELARMVSQEIALVTGCPEIGSTPTLDDAATYWRTVLAKLDQASATLRCIESGRARMEVERLISKKKE